MDLQLFADEDEVIDDIELEDGDGVLSETIQEEDEQLEQDEVEEEAEEEVEEEQPKPTTDKVTKKLVNVKKENKEYRKENDELKRRLEEIERREQERELEAKRQKLTSKYIEEGYDENKALEMADDKIQTETLTQRLDRLEYERKAEKLEARYPDIWSHLADFISLSKKSGLTLEEVCRAKLGDGNVYDSRINSEQAQVIKRQKAQAANTATTAETKPKEVVKLTSAQDKMYQDYIKLTRSTISKKDFLELSQRGVPINY